MHNTNWHSCETEFSPTDPTGTLEWAFQMQ